MACIGDGENISILTSPSQSCAASSSHTIGSSSSSAKASCRSIPESITLALHWKWRRYMYKSGQTQLGEERNCLFSSSTRKNELLKVILKTFLHGYYHYTKLANICFKRNCNACIYLQPSLALLWSSCRALISLPLLHRTTCPGKHCSSHIHSFLGKTVFTSETSQGRK